MPVFLQGFFELRDKMVSAVRLLLLFISESVNPPPLKDSTWGALLQTFQWESSCIFLFIFVEGSTPGISSQHLTDIISHLV